MLNTRYPRSFRSLNIETPYVEVAWRLQSSTSIYNFTSPKSIDFDVRRNFAFNARAHRALLTPSTVLVTVPSESSKVSTIAAPGIDALPYLLLPLAGPEDFDFDVQEKLPEALQFLPPDKIREPDEAIRLILVEVLLLLCHTRWGRDHLRGTGVYEIVRAAHEAESVEKVLTDALT